MASSDGARLTNVLSCRDARSGDLPSLPSVRDSVLLAQPGQLGCGALIKAAVADLPELDRSAFIGHQEQASGAITIIVNGRQRGDLSNLVTRSQESSPSRISPP